MTVPASDRSRVVEWQDPTATAGAAAGRTGLEFMQALLAGEIPPPPIAATIGMRPVAVERGRVEFALEPAEYHMNPIGSVHGGVYATLLDSAAGCAVHTVLEAGVGYTSLDLAVRFVRPMRAGAGTVRCIGTVVSAGRRVALAEARLVDAEDRLLASATSNCLVLRP